MTVDKLSKYFKGWLCGNFDLSLFRTLDFEVAIKKYNKGDFEKLHHHLYATEYTIIAQGKVRMNNIEYITDDIIIIEPTESTDFEALEDTITVVIKTPSVKNDKYFGEY